MKRCELDNLLVQLELNNSDAVFFRNEENNFDAPLHFGIQKKLELIQPDVIYIFNKQPFILFFDLTDEDNKEREDDIHKKVWAFDHSPVIFVIKNKDISIYNALNYSKEKKSLEKIDISIEVRNEKFSFWNLQSGFTWQWLQSEYLNNQRKKETQKRVNEKLFENIKRVREELPKLYLPEQDANSLILRLIFVRYLIDRKVKINTDYILGDVDKISDRRNSFCKLITQPKKLNELFEYLNNRFNGVLFKEQNIILNEEQANFLSYVFHGELQKEGLFKDYFFDIFDFSIIPVELISGIYESLISDETKKLDSAVYTPSFLVDYMLNDTVDKYLRESQTSDCKIFEVAVGSGIFLVQSLRRMIEKEKKINPNSTNEQFSKKIREIAENNLFGIDVNPEALKVTCFSIYIALLDYQKPKEIDKYPFPNLIKSNLFEANFFDTEHIYNKIIKEKQPNFILGNPPWKKDKSPEHLEWLNKENIYSKKVKGEMEIAQSFLLRAKDFMQSKTKAALIVTSTIFYNVSSTAKTFKNKFLKTYCLDKFFDLSPVRRLIFEEKDSPASIVYFRLPKEENKYLTNTVNHLSVKINRFLKYFKMLVIEKFDQKEIQQKHFIENDWLFKVALYGNVLDFVFLKKLEKLSNKKLGSYIDNKLIFGGSGITMGGEKAEENNEKKTFNYLEGLPCLENEQIQPFYTPSSNFFLTKDNCYIKRGAKKQLFEGCKLLFRRRTKNESDLVISVNESTNVFKYGVYGISSVDKEFIYKFFSILNSELYTYFIYFISGAWGTSTRPEVKWEKEFLSFPIIEPDEKTKNELISLVNQFLKPFKEYYEEFKLGKPQKDEKILAQINKIINDIYGIKGYEKDLIDYVLNVSRYQFQESKQHRFTRKVNLDTTFLENYANVFLQEFGKIYDDEFMKVEIYSLNHFIAMNFVFLDVKPEQQVVFSDNTEEKEILKILANSLSVSQITNSTDPTKNLFVQKDIKGFEANSFYIIKPNEYKCWHRAMAWYDVAEFTEKIQTAELERYNQIEE